MPLHMRLPKLKGFKNPNKVSYQVVNLAQLSSLFPDGGTVTVPTWWPRAVRAGQPVKVLGNGDVDVALAVTADKVLRNRGREAGGRGRLIPRSESPATDQRRHSGTLCAGSPGVRWAVRLSALPSRERSRWQVVRAVRSWSSGTDEGGARCSRIRVHLPHPDLRKKVLITLGLLALYRLGCFVPVPGVSYTSVQKCIEVVQGNSPTDSSTSPAEPLLQLSVFALGVVPHITASIIIQLLTVVIPGWRP